MKRIFALQLLAWPAIWSADANTITQGPLTFPGGTGNFNNILTFNRFDTSLGTLTDVAISMTAGGNGTVTVYNFSTGTVSFNSASANVPVQVVGPDGLTIITTLSAGPFSGSVSPGIPFGSTSIPGPDWNATASGSVLPANWGFYSGLGVGTFTLNALMNGASYGGSEVGGSGHLAFSGSETVNGTVTVTYTFIAVPDGGLTAMLLGMGVLGLGLVRRMAK